MQQINARAEASDSFRHFRSISCAHTIELTDVDTNLTAAGREANGPMASAIVIDKLAFLILF
jgi:hypothetical protein